MTRIETGTSLRDFLQRVIDEGVKQALHHRALQEKEKQGQTAPQGSSGQSSGSEGGGTDLFSGGDTSGDAGAEEPTPSKTADDDAETMKKGEVEVKDVTEKLNSIRSGKSFKDDKVAAAMEQYIQSLSTEERTALFAFLKGIAQIVTGEVAGQQASEPGKSPASVEMTKTNEPKTKTIKPNVIKGAAPQQKQQGSEDTSAPTPIVPKKR